MSNAHPTRQRLLQTLARLEAQQTAILDGLRDLLPEAVHRSPGPNVWSISQVLDHLIKVETEVLPIIRANLTQQGRRVTFLGPVRRAMVLLTMYLPVRVPVPRSVSFVRPGSNLPDLLTLRAAWLAARAELSAVLLDLPDAELNRPLVEHPIAGWMTPAQSLAFLHSHIHHHTYQIARLRKSL